MKSKILQSLHQDHANQVQLLSLIESEIDKLRKEGETPNFELLSLALEYCVDYPSHYHHPKEDLLYEKLITRDPAIAEQAIILTEEHETLMQLTREFADAVGEAIAGDTTDNLRAAAGRFLKYYHYHIGIEESEVFPIARRVLTDDDWIEIDAAFRNTADPLFGDHTRDAYLALQRCIVEKASEASA